MSNQHKCTMPVQTTRREVPMDMPDGQSSSSIHGGPDLWTRRGFIVGTLGMTAALVGVRAGADVDANNQDRWRFCYQCFGMFYDGANQKEEGISRCSVSDIHRAYGVNFVLPHDVAEGPNAQKNWRFCYQCFGMFYDADNQRDSNIRCPAGGFHRAYGYNFVLPHDVAEGPNTQKNWRFCPQCFGMFYDAPNQREMKNRCPASDFHRPYGANFVLPHVGFPSAEDQMVDQIGKLRWDAGAPPPGAPAATKCPDPGVRLDARLSEIARKHSEDLAANYAALIDALEGDDRRGHLGSDGTMPVDRLKAGGFIPATRPENTAWAVGKDLTLAEAMDLWLNHDEKSKWGHREAILNCDYKVIGVGMARGDNNRVYWTQNFARS
jgi:hypothetical protein